MLFSLKFKIKDGIVTFIRVGILSRSLDYVIVILTFLVPPFKTVFPDGLQQPPEFLITSHEIGLHTVIVL